jgi:CheY-like chemotaxis protein
VDSSRHLLEEHKHRLALALGEGPFPILGDPTRLEQVLSNLLHNAVRYTPPGGEIELSLQREAGSAVLRVRDNGIGIRPELLERVFDAFQQGDRVPGSVQEGLGLGLTLVKDLVALHDGSVAAFSSGPGSGSEFVVRLPLAPDEACAARASVGPALATTPKRVLVVDDNRDAGETLAMLVRLAGHEARVAHDGAAALELFRASRPDIVLLDIELPHGMSGHEVALRIAREPGAERVMLVAVTGYGQQEDRERSREAGFHLHLVKPVDPRELERVLASSQ